MPDIRSGNQSNIVSIQGRLYNSPIGVGSGATVIAGSLGAAETAIAALRALRVEVRALDDGDIAPEGQLAVLEQELTQAQPRRERVIPILAALTGTLGGVASVTGTLDHLTAAVETLFR